MQSYELSVFWQKKIFGFLRTIILYFSIYNTKCQLLLLYLTYAFVGRTFFFLFTDFFMFFFL